ncbi:Uncharacterized protein BP5553_10144 [Venustampulla echinocandica]|uniref:TRIP4/RQT4 C2HC5-type zinc finger domain-containing protein n=1 Tax=Venustampulla echinocandica TaxID=2656787 RepID=A0A370TAG8_9HELO|nr:Uncharacterized protein BP5553_10144 [Venustampulla echinocandica]RDL30799.1 Uncharacterized protein BP5553_10144 [Venustampulla echinocandica]
MSLAQLSNLLPLPEPELRQVLDYAGTLSKQQAADHFKDLLGESPQSIEFISSFNSRRKDLPTSSPSPSQPSTSEASPSSGVPKPGRRPKKAKAPLHTPSPRQIQDHAAQGTAYVKKNEDDYITKRPIPQATSSTSASTSNNAFALQQKPKPNVQAPTQKPPPSAAGTLISDFKSKSNNSSRKASRTSSPAPPSKTKINITGGTSMHGASSVINELDAAICSLEVSTNSSLLPSSDKRKCNCIGARHPLLAAAPNCLNCGKVICVKEGLGPCTFCGTPLLSAMEVQGMIKELKEERGREKMVLDASSHRRAEVSKKPAPFTRNAEIPAMSPAEAKAKEHRDRLLGYQAQNAKRTTVRDEAADFETPITAGTNIWASPAERARQLKKQQKVLAEQEWNARPEYDKRRQVVSIDLVKGKVVKKMAAMERTPEKESESEEEGEAIPLSDASGNSTGGGGKFSRNPLLGGLIKPVWNSGKGKETATDTPPNESRKKTWRRVQDDLEDNEAVILDGGAYGGGNVNQPLEREEPACG